MQAQDSFKEKIKNWKNGEVIYKIIDSTLVPCKILNIVSRKEYQKISINEHNQDQIDNAEKYKASHKREKDYHNERMIELFLANYLEPKSNEELWE